MRNEMYENLEFNIIKKQVSENCAFSLGVEMILDEKVHFDYLWCIRELNRGKEALQLYVAYRSINFAGVRDLTNTLTDIEKGRIVSEMELYQIAELCRASINVHKYMKESSLSTPAIVDLTSSLSVQRNIISRIEEAISTSYEVKSSASSTLKSIRSAISNTEAEIVRETSIFINKHSDSLMDRITVSRNNRTCVLVKISDKNKIKGYIHGESASGAAVYIEPEVLLQLNNKLQSLKSKESEEIYRILKELTLLVKKEVYAIKSDIYTLGLLDALFAKAKWAYERNGMYASLVENGKQLYFKEARHPLIDSKKVISNTYNIRPPYRHLLITGSNTGGKTVTLKTIGLFTVLTMAGFPVLCEEAIVPYFEGIYVDIGDSQSIVESLSTFSAHISKLAEITSKANDHSLVLLDELGSGTDPNEGESIAIATIDYFREHNIMSVATTHYSKLKEYAKNKEDILLSSVAFDMEKLCPTYKFLEGYSGSSNALAIASRYHLKEEIISNAAKLIEENKSDNEVLMEKLDKERMLLLEEKELLDEKIVALEKEKELFRKEKEKLEKEKDRLLLEAKEKADDILEEAMLEAEEVITKLKAMKKDVKEHEIIAVKSKLNKKEEVEEVNKEHTFKVKDYVRLKKLNYHGEILAIKGNRATILANGMKMNVNTSDLEIMKRVKPKDTSYVSKISSGNRVKSECNVIGLRVEEALITIDKYLDSAMYNRVYDVRLVHGHGTGALRVAIHKYLKQCKHVESFRLGGEGEGGMGATVVSLKRGGK